MSNAINGIPDQDVTGTGGGGGSGTVVNDNPLTADDPVIGADGADKVKSGTRSGNTTEYATSIAGAKVTGHIATWDANDNLQDGGAVPTGTVTATGGSLTNNASIWGAGGTDIKVGTKSGNTNETVTGTGSKITGHYATWDSNGNLQDGGAATTFAHAEIGFIMGDGTAGTNVGPALRAKRAGSFSEANLTVKSSNGGTNLVFNIRKNGTNIFSSNRTVTAGAAASSVHSFPGSDFTSNPLTFSVDDVFTIDIITGAEDWQFTLDLEH